MIKVHWREMHFVFVSGFYDIPLSGTCIHDGKLCRFHIEVLEGDQYQETEYYIITPLTRWEAFKARFNQKMFEMCVGKHWSYDGNRRRSHYYVRSPEWLHNLLFRAYYYVTMRGWKR